MGGVQQSGVSPATSLRGWMAAAASALCWRVQHQLARRVGAGWRPAGLQSYNTPDVRAREGADYSLSLTETAQFLIFSFSQTVSHFLVSLPISSTLFFWHVSCR